MLPTRPETGGPGAEEAEPPEALAARLASKLCHDFANPIGGVVTGLGLLEDPTAKDMRDEAMELIAASARKLTDLLAFARIAFGASAGAGGVDGDELRRLTEGVFSGVRADLDWAGAAGALPKTAAQALLNLAQLGAGALPFGGVARVGWAEADGELSLAAEARGGRARLHPEVRSGLAGEALGDGLAARWVQAYFLHALVRSAGGEATVEATDELVSFRVRMPA